MTVSSYVLAVKKGVREAALSHAAGCRCTVCRAAGGDREAMVEILYSGRIRLGPDESTEEHATR